MPGRPNEDPRARAERLELEQRWLDGIRAGRLDLFRAMFETFLPELWRFARLSVPADIAEDIVQDVMADLWQRRETVVVQNGLTPYLFGAVRNRIVKYRRHEAVVARTETEVAFDEPPGMGEREASPEEHIIADDLETALADALERLSEMQRAILTLRWTQEMSYEQIAATLSISVAAAKQQVSRTKRIIRPLLARFVDER